jgi:hypothetical protein
MKSISYHLSNLKSDIYPMTYFLQSKAYYSNQLASFPPHLLVNLNL